MAEKDTSQWYVYDWLDVMEVNRYKRRCPKCGGEDCKFAIHDPKYKGFGLSVQCNDCKHYECGANIGSDAERIVDAWHEAPNSL